MRVKSIDLLILLLVWTVVAGAQAAPKDTQAASRRTARILVIITNSGNSPANRSFSAIIDSQPSRIVEFAPAKHDPLIFAILIDVSSSSRDKQTFVKKACVNLFQAFSTDQNVGYFGDFDDQVHLGKQPTDLKAINKELADPRLFGGRTAFYDAVFRAAQLISEAHGHPNARRAVIVFSDGDDNASSRTLKETIREAQDKGVFCVGLLASKKAGERLRTLSAATGGNALLLTRADDYIRSLQQSLANQFWMTVQLPEAANRPRHDLKLTSADTNISVSFPAQFSEH